MMSSSSAALLCAKCGTGAATPQAACGKCGGALVKVCGKCGFQSSPAKIYCDQCGTALLLNSAAIAPPQDYSDMIPATAVGRRASVMSETTPNVKNPSRTLSAHQAPQRPIPSKRWFLRAGATILGLVLTIGGFAVYINLTSPQRILPRLAADYLSRLAQGDMNGAYAFLSSAAQTTCSLEDFRAARENTPWTWSHIALARLEADIAVVRYTLHIRDLPPQDDYIFFVREHGQWKRPFNWNLFKKIEDAFDKHTPDLAEIIAREALSVNARDPMAQAYLCEAVFYRHQSEQTVATCTQALTLAATYPSRLSAKSLYHLHALLGDTYKNSMRRYPQAISEYTAMLAFPNVSPDDRCNLLLARADTSLMMARYEPARLDLDVASNICIKQEDKNFISHARAQLR